MSQLIRNAYKRIEASVASTIIDAGYASPGSIPEHMTFLEWCRDLARKGLKVDGRPFDLEDRPSLIPLYEAIPTTKDEASRRTLVLMKGSQMGATIWEMLADLYMAIKWEPVTIGMFLPDQATAADKSERRFMRVIRSIPDVYQKLTTRNIAGRIIRVQEGNILTRLLGESSFLFLWTSGKVTTESRPMDCVSLDEVQQISLEQIDKVYERMSASRIRYRLMLSTANVPESDIDHWFRQGTQNCWHTECPHCAGENDLSQHWPDCCVYNEGQIKDAPHLEYVYVCPDCGGWIEDPQKGRFVAYRPAADIESYHISQIISPTISARDLMVAWNQAVTGDQRKSFYNRKLGRPYIDRDQLPVSMSDCLECARLGIEAGLKWLLQADGCYMGIDQMGSWCVVIIKQRMPDNRQAVVHVEAIFNDNPFERCAALMDIYGVEICVVEQLPNVNDARRFANRFRSRVYLAGYSGDAKADMVVWGDAQTRSDRKTSEEDRERYTVVLQQYKAMQMALFRIKNKFCLFPDPAKLEQEVWENGVKKRIQIVRDWVFLHFTKTALVIETPEMTATKSSKRAIEARAPRPKVVKVGIDPHFSFANMLCDVAWTRVHGQGMFILAQSPGSAASRQSPDAEKLERAMPGLPAEVVHAMTDRGVEGTCGACLNFRPDGFCTLRDFGVEAKMQACDLYDPKEDNDG